MSIDVCFHRRGFLGDMATGLAGIALGTLLGEAEAKAAPRLSHFAPKAKRVLQIFCPGGVSHLDTFDYKPELAKRDGQLLPGEEKLVSFQGKNGPLMKSPWRFRQHGETGKWLTEMLPHLASHVDDMAFIHSMVSRSNTHGPACVFMNTGFVTDGFPANGAWISYALGSDNQDLPTYVAITDLRGEPPSGPANWGSGFLPAEHQGVALNAHSPLRNLSLPEGIKEQAMEASSDFLRELNLRHAAEHPGDERLTARIAAYQLAARMQLSAPEAANLAQESAATHALYGTGDANFYLAAYARNCLLARRLLERNVRYVTLYCASRASGVDGLLNWDAHKKLKADYERHCPIFDRPTAALLTDLKSCGLLDDTLVLWTTEFGRMPTRQEGTAGRDHNPDGFTCWMMGAGVRKGVSYGATDALGRRAVENVATVHDFYATILQLLGLDHTQLAYYYNGTNRRLTDVHGHVLQEVLA
jgi:hypothetical protein